MIKLHTRGVALQPVIHMSVRSDDMARLSTIGKSYDPAKKLS